MNHEIPQFVVDYFNNHFKRYYNQLIFEETIKQYPDVLKWLTDNNLEPKFIGRTVVSRKSNIIPHCPICGKFLDFEKKYINYAKTCGSIECSNQYRTQTCKERYGVEHPLKLKTYRDKQHQTMIEKYGVPYANQSEICQSRRDQTMMERYGTTNIHHVPSIVNKIKQTWIDRYGFDNPMKNPEVLQKNQQAHKDPNSYGPSKMEQQLITYIKERFPKMKIIPNVVGVINCELDIWIPECKVAFEFDGTYWHNIQKVGQFHHFNKSKSCFDNGVVLIHISSDDWLYKTQQSKDLIYSVLDTNLYDIDVEETQHNLQFVVNGNVVGECLLDRNSDTILVSNIVSRINKRQIISSVIKHFASHIQFELDLYHDSLLLYPSTYSIIQKCDPRIIQCTDGIKMYDCGSLKIIV